MRGFNVLHCTGWDAFGLPAEEYARKTGIHPAITTRENIATFRRQMKRVGLSHDWDREINTTDPGYYRWTQWIFLKLFERGLAYVADVPVNWCPELGTVLANEEVIDGKSEVGGYDVIRKPMRQWVLKITAYAERLLDDLALVDWPASTLEMQRNWIGRSIGAEVDFPLDGANGGLRIFTTRPDTLFGATYMVLAPEHALVGRRHDAGTARAAVDALPRADRAQERPAAAGAEGQDRRVHRRARREPRQRREAADLDRRLRAHGLRHGRHHGRAWARRARLESSRARSGWPIREVVQGGDVRAGRLRRHRRTVSR